MEFISVSVFGILIVLLAISPFLHVLDRNAWRKRRKYLWFSGVLAFLLSLFIVTTPFFHRIPLSLGDLLELLCLGILLGSFFVGLSVWLTWKMLRVVHNNDVRKSGRGNGHLP